MNYRRRWPLPVMIGALVSTFTLSQSYRTVPAVTAGRIAAEFGLDQQQIGLFAATFHLAFALMQIGVGISLDRFGARRTIIPFFSVTVLGSLLSAVAPSYPVLLAGQVLIGFGCAPALLASIYFVGTRLPPERFTAVSGLLMSIGGAGVILTSTPLAWIVAGWSWRAGFLVLAVLSALATLACWVVVEPDPPSERHAETVLGSLRQMARVVTLPQGAGIVILGGITYASSLSIRALWVVPLFTERYGFSLVQAGNVALIMSLTMIGGPVAFGRLDPGASRRTWIVVLTLLMAAQIAFLGFSPAHSATVDIIAGAVLGFMSGFVVLQYADARASYPPELAGRALSALTMSMFLGVAVLQWVSSVAAGFAAAHGGDPVFTAFMTIAAVAVAGAVAFRLLPSAAGTGAVGK